MATVRSGAIRPRGKLWGNCKNQKDKKKSIEKVENNVEPGRAKPKNRILVELVPNENAKQFNLSDCPMRYYGETYEQLFVNVTDEHLIICLDSYYNNDSLGDCIKISSVKKTKVFVAVRNNPVRVWSLSLLNITTAQCKVQFRFYFTDRTNFYVKGNAHVLWNLDGAVATISNKHLLPSACRYQDSLIEPDTLISTDPDTCSKTTCDSTGQLQTIDCGIHQICIGNNVCTLDILCAVLGSSVVDFTGNSWQVPNTCSYKLMQTADFYIEASFTERRRMDVNFIDTITFKTSNDTFILVQGLVVYFNGEPQLQLSASPRNFSGVDISKDENGVTLKKTFNQFRFSMVFDGTTAQITYNGLGLLKFTGLCADSDNYHENLIVPKDICTREYQEAPDLSINSSAVEKLCQSFLAESFSPCHLEIDPQPYVQVCQDIFIVYPNVDEIFCQLLESYTRICNLRLNSSLEDTSSAYGCVSVLDVCDNIFCSGHEFCGINLHGDAVCLCRAIIAAPFRESKSYGLPVECGMNTASVTLVACLLQEKGFDYRDLHLADPSCHGELNPVTHMLSFNFSDRYPCGAEITANGSQIIYRNKVMFENSSPGIITRSTDFHISIECIYIQPKQRSLPFTIKETSVVQHIVGLWNYTLRTKSYLDRALSMPISVEDEILLNQRVWLELLAGDLNSEMYSLVMDSCWATNTPEPTDPLKHDLIIDGCANRLDGTVTVEVNGDGTRGVFAFDMFQFTGQPGHVIYLHCTMHMCVRNYALACVPKCSGLSRKRRSLEQKMPSVMATTFRPEAKSNALGRA
ncbi:hypothetical protein WMY93_014724 [Mugilogobius chulae]|uniref:ZP domain-containing protein n=1 Tax=Mugilogobius chulae TaxID=88201 RepID=A0AAW0P7D3_9GOBI